MDKETAYSPWTYQGLVVDQMPEGVAGFVYRIYYLGTNSPHSYYVGAKLFVHKTTKKAPKAQQLTKSGKPRKRVVKVRGTKESNWKSYFGSCLPLKELVKTEPAHLFRREILAFGKTKQQVFYMETKLLYCEGVLEDPQSFNQWVCGRKTFKWAAQGLTPPPRKKSVT